MNYTNTAGIVFQRTGQTKHTIMKKREFLKTTSKAVLLGGAALSMPSAFSLASASEKKLFFEISLAQWSLHRTIRKGDLDNLDFAMSAKKDFGINAVEYVNQFFKDKAKDKKYLGEMNTRAADNGVKNVLVMIDGEGNLGSLDEKERTKSVENHYKWVEAAQFLGCHSIRVNARGEGDSGEVAKSATEGLRQLSVFAKDYDINVIVENHGGDSSIGTWLMGVIKGVGLPNCGTLPDFGNFYEYDRYQGIEEMMPYAKGVSAKSYTFDEAGNETKMDYERILKIVKDAGYTGHIGIEFEGNYDEAKGIMDTKKLLIAAGEKVS